MKEIAAALMVVGFGLAAIVFLIAGDVVAESKRRTTKLDGGKQ